MEEELPGPRRGRPQLPAGEGKVHTIAIRTTRELRDRLKRASEASGRSLAREIERRLDQSFEREHLKNVMREELASLRSAVTAALGITQGELDQRMAALRRQRSVEEVGQRFLELLEEEQARYAAAAKDEVRSAADQVRAAVSKLLTFLKPATGEG